MRLAYARGKVRTGRSISQNFGRSSKLYFQMVEIGVPACFDDRSTSYKVITGEYLAMIIDSQIDSNLAGRQIPR